MSDQPGRENLREALKRVAAALKQSGVPFALVGGYAVWARGGPEPDHDVDFLVAETDADKVAALLAEQGFQVHHPPEDWLFKVYTDDVMIDVIFRVRRQPADTAIFEHTTEMEVLSVSMPVLSATELMVEKMNALDEHYCDLATLLPVARALREQIDWEQVWARTAENDFAAALLFLLRRLDIL